MKNCEQFLPDLCAWIDGELEDSRALEAHLAECASCRALAEQYRQIDAMLAQTEPPSELHERIIQGVTASRSPKRRFAFGSATAVAAVAAVLLLAIGMGWIRTPRMKSAEAPAAAEPPAAASTGESATESALFAETTADSGFAAEEPTYAAKASAYAEAPAAEKPAAFAAAPKMTAAAPQAEPAESRECPSADSSAEGIVLFDADEPAADTACTSEECVAPMKALMQSAESDDAADTSGFWLLSDSTPDTLPDDFASLQFAWGEAGIAGYPVWSAQTDADTFRQLLDACGDLPGRVIGDGEPYRIILLPDSSEVRLIWRIRADAQLPAGMQACLTFEAGEDGALCAETDHLTLWALYLSCQDTPDGEIRQTGGSCAQIILEP